MIKYNKKLMNRTNVIYGLEWHENWISFKKYKNLKNLS